MTYNSFLVYTSSLVYTGLVYGDYGCFIGSYLTLELVVPNQTVLPGRRWINLFMR